jgi:hypothetical protein
MTGIHLLVLGLLLFGFGLMLVRYTGALRRPTADENQGINPEGPARVRFGEQIDRAKAENKTEIMLPAPILMPTPVN